MTSQPEEPLHAASQLRRIGVIGGGTAGYLSALALARSLPAARVTVVESSRIPVIGVGESTTPVIIELLHRVLGFDVAELYAAVAPTWKLGTRLVWGLPGEHVFDVPFGPLSCRKAIHHTPARARHSLHSLLMDGKRSIVFEAPGRTPPHTVLGGPLPYAYHLDNKLLLGFLRRKLAASGIEHVEAEIARTEATADGTCIDRLTTTDGRVLRFDLLLDCSGFRSLLLGQALRTPFLSFESSLPTNRAVIGVSSLRDGINPYTLATTMNHGWRWTIPLRAEDHFGYVYCSRFCSDDEAAAELRAASPGIREVEARALQYRAGRHADFWRGNVVGIGNAYGFVEPLHSTGLHMAATEIMALIEELRSGGPIVGMQRRLNAVLGARWDMLRWYLTLHFRFNRRIDTPFWRFCREELDGAGVEEYIEFFERLGPMSEHRESDLNRRINRDSVFGSSNFDLVMLQTGRTFERGPVLSAGERAVYEQEWRINRVLATTALSHEEGLRRIEEQPTLVTFDRWSGALLHPDAAAAFGPG